MSVLNVLKRLKQMLAQSIIAISFSTLPMMAQADTLGAAGNWVGNMLFGWTDCFKGAANEVGKAADRGYIGVLVTAPLSCGANVAVRYGGNVADVIVIPASGKNVVNPATLESWSPPVIFPLNK